MKRKLRYTIQARLSLHLIVLGIIESGGDASVARGVTVRLRAKCRSLAKLPGVFGRGRPELRKDLRSLTVGNHVVFFRYVEDVFRGRGHPRRQAGPRELFR